MYSNKLNGWSAVVAQILLIVLFGPMFILVVLSVFGGPLTFEAVVFLLVFLSFSLLVFRFSFRFADIYIENDRIVIRKLFSKVELQNDQISSFGKALLPLTYYIKYNSSKILFMMDLSDLPKQIFSQDPDKILSQLQELKK